MAKTENRETKYTRRLPAGRTAELRQEIDSAAGTGSKSKFVARERVVNHMPHDEMFSRRLITEDQHETAERLHRLFVLGCLVGVAAQNFEARVDQALGHELSQRAADARRVFKGELQRCEAVGADLLWSVCGEGLTPTKWAAAKGVRIEYAMERLREALDTVAGSHKRFS
jgi:hypothetical protein